MDQRLFPIEIFMRLSEFKDKIQEQVVWIVDRVFMVVE